MGAISSTTETDVDKFVASNIRSTLDLWQWCAANQTRFIYASSAATYGDGERRLQRRQSPAALALLRPLNRLRLEQAIVDRRSSTMCARPAIPPQWAGLKFFNVYGPNEAHKGDMQSIVSKILPIV